MSSKVEMEIITGLHRFRSLSLETNTFVRKLNKWLLYFKILLGAKSKIQEENV